jgi:predicted proteasome-type protease
MTDRVHALTVVLDRDMRDDDVQVVIDAIKMIKFVASVGAHVTDVSDYSARERAKSDIEMKLQHAIYEIINGKPVPGRPPILAENMSPMHKLAAQG